MLVLQGKLALEKRRPLLTPGEELIMLSLWLHFWAGKCATQEGNNEVAEISDVPGEP